MINVMKCVAAAALTLVAGASSAAVVQIQMGGIDLNYSEGTGLFCDNGGGVGCFATEDALDTMTFKVGGVVVPGGVYIPGVNIGSIGLNMLLNITAGSNPFLNTTYNVTGASGQVFDAEINSNPGLFTNVASGSVTFSNNSVNATGTGFSSVFAQSLPFGLVASDPINWSFSSGLGTCTGVVGQRICTYSGTGELSWTQRVPEPSSLLLAGGALLALGAISRRRRSSSAQG